MEIGTFRRMLLVALLPIAIVLLIAAVSSGEPVMYFQNVSYSPEEPVAGDDLTITFELYHNGSVELYVTIEYWEMETYQGDVNLTGISDTGPADESETIGENLTLYRFYHRIEPIDVSPYEVSFEAKNWRLEAPETNVSYNVTIEFEGGASWDTGPGTVDGDDPIPGYETPMMILAIVGTLIVRRRA